MNFIVTVACAIHLTSCPLQSPMVSEFQAQSKTECESKVAALIEHYAYKRTDFNINCKRK